MKRKFICMVLATMFLCMTLQILPVSARVQFSDFDVNVDASGTTVTYKLSNTPEGESVALVAALINTVTCEITEIDWETCEDASLLIGEPKSISVSLEGSESGNVKLFHYLWNNLTDMSSLQNFAPISPELTSVYSEITSSDMSWTASRDDYDNASDLSYNIYDDGMLLNEQPVSGLQYTVQDLVPGAEYHLAVKALDSENTESDASNQMKTSTYMPNTITNSVKPKTDDETIGALSKDGNLLYAPKASVPDTAMYIYYADNLAGLNCFRNSVSYRATSGTTPNYTRGFSRLGYKLTNPASDADTTYAYEITYFDRYEENNGAASMRMQYYMQDGNDADAIYDSASVSITLDNDNAWKTVKGTFKPFTPLQGIPLTGNGADATANETMVALWTNRAWNSTDWQENRTSEGLTKEYLYEKDYLRVYRFTLIPLDETYKHYKKLSGASLTIENPSQYEAATIISGLDSNAKGFYLESSEKPLVEKDGRFAVALSDLSDNMLTFTVEDTTIKGQAGKIELCCYAEEETVISLEGINQTIPANTWTKLRFVQDSVSDNTYTVTSDHELYVSSLRVTAN